MIVTDDLMVWPLCYLNSSDITLYVGFEGNFFGDISNTPNFDGFKT